MQAEHNLRLSERLRHAVVVPVLTVEEPRSAAALARALVDGGLDVLEITLRTPAAIEAMRTMVEACPTALVGAGTVRTPEQATAAMRAGAQFLVSPGMTPALAEAAERWPAPWLPGVATVSEAMALHDLGYRVVKLFPAEAVGGLAWVKAVAAPLAGLQFCPTGGIHAANARAWLAEPNVVCVGGSWVAPAKAVADGDWQAISALAARAKALAPTASGGPVAV